MCEHLFPLEQELRSKNIREIFHGTPWSENAAQWIYYDCYLDVGAIIGRLSLPSCIEHITNDDPRSGLEEGLYCTSCKDAVMGYHRVLNSGRRVPVIH